MRLTNGRFGLPNEDCLLLPSLRTAQSCRDFLASRDPPVRSRLVQFPIEPAAESSTSTPITLHACFFEQQHAPVAKQFWQHSGDGISSRLAERCLSILEAAAESVSDPAEEDASMIVAKGGRYAASKARTGSAGLKDSRPVPSSKLRYSSNGRSHSSGESTPTSMANSVDSLQKAAINANGRADEDEDVLERYVEERYGRNLHLSLAPMAKLAMRRRIAGVLRETPQTRRALDDFGQREDPSSRGVSELTEDDVWLYPCGMSAIFHAHQLAMKAATASSKKIGKSVCFGCASIYCRRIVTID